MGRSDAREAIQQPRSVDTPVKGRSTTDSEVHRDAEMTVPHTKTRFSKLESADRARYTTETSCSPSGFWDQSQVRDPQVSLLILAGILWVCPLS